MKNLKEEDLILPFSFSKANIKGKIVRLNKTSKKLLNRFSTNINNIDKIFLDSLALSQIISSNFKFEGTFKLQLNCYNGIIKMILCDNKINGNMRAYMGLHDNYQANNNINNLTFKEIIGEGVMVFHLYTKNAKQPYQALVELNGENLSESACNWFDKSEQISTYIKIFSNVKTQSTAALFIQKIPNQYSSEEQKEEDNEIFNTFKILSNTLSEKEILEDNLETILYKLYNEFEIMIYEKIKVSYKCTCSKKVIKEVIATLTEEEQNNLRKENNGFIKTNCSFCGKEYLL